MSIEQATFGLLEGRAVEVYTLINRKGRVLKVTNYGATVTELHVPDRNGRLADVVLGFGRLDQYVDHRAFLGATVGRVANRIRGAVFTLDGQRHELASTDGPHHLHGGRRGFDRVVWSAVSRDTDAGPSLTLQYTSPDGEEGYPGQLQARASYTLTHDDALVIAMEAESDQGTIVNMAHHTYWNLGGHASGHVLDHELSLHAALYTPGDPVVPVGTLEPVANTPFDFRRPKPIGRDLERVGADPPGFDHNWVVDGVSDQMRPVAELHHPGSGRWMSLEADAPGVQFYSGNFLDGSLEGKEQRYERHAGLCLETQAFPNAISIPEWAPQVILRPGQTYRHKMVHRFSVR